MLVQALLLAASAALASAQITYNGSQIICPADKPNGNFCAGSSLSTNIIIRCVNGVAQPGNCNDNLDGEPPVGLFPTTCWQTSDTSGDASCAKNCIVYSSSPFTLPNCTPFYTASSSSSAAPSTSSYPTSPTTSSTTTSTGTTIVTTGSTTLTQTFTTTYCPPTSTGTGTPPPPPTNGTTIISSKPGGGSSPTKTPSGPSSTLSGFTGGATGLSPMGAIAGAGLLVAYFL